MSQNIIKVGILIDSYQLPFWVYTALKRVISSPATCVDLVIIKAKPASSDTTRSKFIYQLFNKLDKQLFNRAESYNKKTSIEPLLTNIPTLTITDCETNKSEFKQSDINLISKKQLDILINIGAQSLNGEILDLPKYGVWIYQLGKNDFNQGPLAGFWEAVTKQPTTGATLKSLPGKRVKGQIIYQSEVMTKEFIPALNKPSIHYLAAAFLSRQIELLYHLGEDQFFSQINKNQPTFDFYSYPDFREPNNLDAFLLFSQYILQIAAKVLRKLFYYEHWYLFYDLKPEMSQTLNQFKKLLPPKDRFWADPHIIHQDNNYYIFFEELMYNTGRGHLSVIEMDSKGNCKEPVVILKKDYHLSYPFVFKAKNTYYMIPESVENNTIQLYESSDFPFQWEFKMNLMENIKAVDTTLLFKDNKWWLFTAMSDVDGSSVGDELCLFWSQELLTNNWTPHPLNPIVSGTQTARPAGKFFMRNNKLYRPSQDCSVRYGHCTNINEVTEFSETVYNEKTLSTITPNWDKHVLGTHTLNYEGDLTIVDAYYYRRRFF
jgi:hypothetical protein